MTLSNTSTLLDRGADISVESAQNPPTALMMAIDQQSFDIVKTLVKHRCDVNQAFEDGTPLLLAIKKGELRIVRYLLQHNAHVDTVALLNAVLMQNIEHLRCLLIHHEKAGGPKTDLSTSALAASRAGNEDALSLLLENGADIDARTKGRETLVWFAAAGGYYRSLNLLLAKGADIEKRARPRACTGHQSANCLFAEQDVHRCTAVQIAVSHGHWDCARLLIRHGGDLSDWVHGRYLYKRYNRLLHLMIIAPVNPTEKLQVLADMGADPNVEDPDGQTSLHIVSTNVAINRADRVTMARILVSKGARVNFRDEMGVTPLHCTFRRGSTDFEFIEFLLKNGADPNIEDCTGRTPFDYAEWSCTPEILKLARAAGKADATDDRSPRFTLRCSPYQTPTANTTHC